MSADVGPTLIVFLPIVVEADRPSVVEAKQMLVKHNEAWSKATLTLVPLLTSRLNFQELVTPTFIDVNVIID